MRAVFPFKRGEFRKIIPTYFFEDTLFESGIDERHAAALEARAGEPPAVDAVRLRHDLVELFQLRRTGLPVVDGGISAFEGQPSVLLDVSASPCICARFHALVFRIPVLGPLRPALREAVFVPNIDLSWNVPEEGFIELAVFHAGKGFQGVSCASQLIHAHIVLRSGKCPFDPAEEDHNLARFHLRVFGDQLVAVILRVQIKQVVFQGIDLAALVQLAAGDADIVVLRSKRHHDNLVRRRMEPVDLAKCGEEGDDDRRRGGEPADGERSFYDAGHAEGEGDSALQARWWRRADNPPSRSLFSRESMKCATARADQTEGRKVRSLRCASDCMQCGFPCLWPDR